MGPVRLRRHGSPGLGLGILYSVEETDRQAQKRVREVEKAGGERVLLVKQGGPVSRIFRLLTAPDGEARKRQHDYAQAECEDFSRHDGSTGNLL